MKGVGNNDFVGKMQKDLYAFYLFINSDLQGADGFATGDWERELCDFFHQVYQRFLNNERPIATSEEPVQHGKSTKLRIFLCWLAGRHKNLRFNFYTADDRLRAETQDFVASLLNSERYKQVFGNIVRKATKETIYLTKSGRIDFRLMGAGNTGYPSHISIIDDPYRNAEDANSPTMRDKIENRFRGDIMSRRQNRSMVVILHSRWNTNDLIGMLKSDPYFKNVIISSRHPALSADGKALFPTFRTKEFLMEQKKALGTANFESLYQQNPIIQGGNLIKTDWFRKYNVAPVRFDKVFIVADTALTESKSADYSAFLLCGILGSHIYLLDGYCKKVVFPDLRRDLKQFWLKANAELNTRVATIYIENKGSGISLIQTLRAEDGLPVSELYPTYFSKSARREMITDKYTRFQEIAADLESGYVYVPESAGWMLEFASQCEAFTGGKQDAHDDYVDCLMYALKERRKFIQPKTDEPIYGAMKW